MMNFITHVHTHIHVDAHVHAHTHTHTHAYNSRGGKIRFYENKGSDGVKICVRKHMEFRGSGIMPPGIFVFSTLSGCFCCILRYLRMTKVISGY